MELQVDFENSELDEKLQESIICRIKKRFNKSFISSVKVIIKKPSGSNKVWTSEIDLVSAAGSILHTQSKGTANILAFDAALMSMEKQITYLKNEKLAQRA